MGAIPGQPKSKPGVVMCLVACAQLETNRGTPAEGSKRSSAELRSPRHPHRKWKYCGKACCGEGLDDINQSAENAPSLF